MIIMKSNVANNTRRMLKTRKLDVLGFVAGVSFLISGIIVRQLVSDEKV